MFGGLINFFMENNRKHVNPKIKKNGPAHGAKGDPLVRNIKILTITPGVKRETQHTVYIIARST